MSSCFDFVRVNVPRALRVHGPLASDVQTTTAYCRETLSANALLELTIDAIAAMARCREVRSLSPRVMAA
jgi:hypothetical protein